MIKIGLLGCGGIAQYHVDGWLRNTDVARITAIADAVEANVARTRAKLGEVPVYTDFARLIAEADVDAVDICLPHHLHKPAIVAAANAGKHVLCEKPLCMNADEAREIVAAVKANGVTVMCAHNQLFEAATAEAQAFLAAGRLGRVFSVVTCDCGYHRPDEQWGWRAKRATAGGGELIDTGYHPTYLLLRLAGSRPVAVTGMVENFAQPGLEGEDSAQVLVRFENRAIGHIFTSWSWDWPEGAWQFHVIGEKGQIYGRGNTFYFRPLGGQVERRELPAVNGFQAETRHFAEALRDGVRPIQTEVEGIAVLQVILGAYESSEKGVRVPVREIA